MTTSVLEHEFTLTESEKDILKNKLDSVINQKCIDKSLILSSSVANSASDLKGQDHKPTSVDLSIYGLNNPEDIKNFLLTPAGATIKFKINLEKAIEKEKAEVRQSQIQAQLIEEQRKILLFHWLLSEEEKETQEAQEELILLQNEHAIKNSGQDPHKNESSVSKETLHNTAKYETPIFALKQSEKSLREIEKKLKNERIVIAEKYNNYEEGLDDLEQSAPEVKSIGELEKDIKDLEKQADNIADQMSKISNEEELQKLVNKLNTIGLKIAVIQDLIAVKKDEKIYVNDDGEGVDADGKPISHKDAVFVLSKGQQLIKENNEYHLLENELQWDNMDETQKAAAKQNFQNKKNDIKTVKDVVNDVKKQEILHNETRIAETKAELLIVKNQRNLMQAALANAKNLMQKPLDLQSPESTLTGAPSIPLDNKESSPSLNKETNTPEPTPIFTAKAFVETELNDLRKQNDKDYRPTWKDLFSITNKIKDPKAKEQIDKLLDPYKMLKDPPVPHEVMATLLKNMARFNLNPYDQAITSEKSPLDQSLHPSQGPEKEKNFSI